MAVINNPVDRKKIKDALIQISDSYTRIEAERELIKDIVADISEKFELEKKHIILNAKVYHKQNYSEQVSNSEEFQELYESLFEVQ